jgi:hypothetical protein
VPVMVRLAVTRLTATAGMTQIAVRRLSRRERVFRLLVESREEWVSLSRCAEALSAARTSLSWLTCHTPAEGDDVAAASRT